MGGLLAPAVEVLVIFDGEILSSEGKIYEGKKWGSSLVLEDDPEHEKQGHVIGNGHHPKQE